MSAAERMSMRRDFLLYGTPSSLYTARVRSFFRKQQIPFTERPTSDREFQTRIVTTVGRFIIPVVVTPDDEVLQDGVDILDRLTATMTLRYAPLPASPKLRAVTHLFELFGAEGLLRPAMHYRWNFDGDNLDFLERDFGVGLPGTIPDEKAQVFQLASARMRKAAASFGVTEESIPAIEASYLEFLDLMNDHFAQYPYLLGRTGTLGDYALIGPLFAHLGRDPYPASLMKQRAPYLFHWTERMNAADDFGHGFPEESPASVPEDEVPPTLLPVLRYIAEDFLPETKAHTAFTDEWLSEREDIQAGTNGLSDPARRFIGWSSFMWRGQTLKTSVLPYRFYVLQRLQDFYDSLDESAQQDVFGLLAEGHVADLLACRLSRRVERKNSLEVWGPKIN